ncbi:hypothetical protein GC177_05865 [bacterium]|nr:hypothetical protein [bacterium]
MGKLVTDDYINQLVFGTLAHGRLYPCAEDADLTMAIALGKAVTEAVRTKPHHGRHLGRLFKNTVYDEYFWMEAIEQAKPNLYFLPHKDDEPDFMLKVLGEKDVLIEDGIVVEDEETHALALAPAVLEIVQRNMKYMGFSEASYDLDVRTTTYDGSTCEPDFGVYLLVAGEGLRKTFLGESHGK